MQRLGPQQPRFADSSRSVRQKMEPTSRQNSAADRFSSFEQTGGYFYNELMAFEFIPTKFHAPAPPATTVRRPGLLTLLDEGMQARLILVSAPAGFGKSTLLADWAEWRKGHPRIAWLHLSSSDDDWSRFLAYVIRAIQTQQENIGDSALSALESVPAPPAEATLTSLLNDLDALNEQLVLVLDDYHVIEEHAIHEAVAFLLEHMPGQVHMAILTRADPPLPLHKLRVDGQLVEIRSEHLRFDLADMRRFLSDAAGFELPVDELEVIDRRVEGWIAGIQLLALSLQGKRNVRGYVETFGASNRFVLDYLTEEVFNSQEASVQQFLMRTAVLKRLCGPLCDYVLEREGTASGEGLPPNAQDILEHLERSNLFLIALDDERGWYRYHHLFAELLRQRLRQLAPDETPLLLGRASEWCAASGYLEEAFQYALAAGDAQAAGDIVRREGYGLLRKGSLSTLIGWLKKLPEPVIRGSARLSVIRAWALLLTAQNVDIEGDLRAAEQQIGSEDPSGELRGTIAAIRAYEASRRQDIDTALQQAQLALDWLPDDEFAVRCVVSYVLGGIYSLKGETANAMQAWKDAGRLGERSGNVHLAIVAWNSTAAVLIRQGELKQAGEMFARATKLGTSPNGKPLPVAASTYAGLGKYYMAQNDLERAREHAQAGYELGKQWVNADSQINSLLTLAQVAQLEGQPEAADTWMETIAQLASTRVLMPGTEANIENVMSNILEWRKGKGHAGGLIEPLSQREMEVLHLIADGSTNPEIAETLIVALGTVKAHTSSIYRKLDVSNRTQAVLRAKELGIL